MRREMGGRFKRKGIYVYLWLIHVDVCIILQLKINKLKKKRKAKTSLCWFCMLVSQSCLTLCYPMDSSPPASSVHEILQSGVCSYHSLLQVIFLTQGSKSDLLYCRWIHYRLSNQGGPKKAERQRTDTFKLWCWGKFLKAAPSARKSNQSILKEIKPEYLLGGLMLKLKVQYAGHLM